MASAWKVYGPYRTNRDDPGGYFWERVESTGRWDTVTYFMDTVFFDSDMNGRDVYQSLVGHDGYPDDIRVEREQKETTYDPDGDNEDWYEGLDEENHLNAYDPHNIEE